MTDEQFTQLIKQLDYIPLAEALIIISTFKLAPEIGKQEILSFYQNQLKTYQEAKQNYEKNSNSPPSAQEPQ